MYIVAWVLVAFPVNATGVVQPVAFQQTYKTQAECVAHMDQLRKQEPKSPPLACIPRSKSDAR